MKYCFFVNPVAGKGTLQNTVIKNIKDYFKDKSEKFEIIVTKCKGEAEKIAKKFAETGEELWMFACGGEGTFYEVLNGIVGYKNVNIGVIPCGSANDFLKVFNSDSNFSNISSQIDGNSVEMDIIKAGDRYCMNGCSVGMDAIVCSYMTLFKNLPFVSGAMAYKLAIVKAFLHKIGVKINLKVNSNVFNNRWCLFAVIANGPYYGGGFMAAPKAVPNDGKLNFTLVDLISKLKIPKFLKKYEKGDIEDLSYCQLDECEEMSFTADKPIPINLDGEIIESTEMKFSIVKNAVRFIIPKGVNTKLLTNV